MFGRLCGSLVSVVDGFGVSLAEHFHFDILIKLCLIPASNMALALRHALSQFESLHEEISSLGM